VLPAFDIGSICDLAVTAAGAGCCGAALRSGRCADTIIIPQQWGGDSDYFFR
jgi:hypothetical protein